MFNVNAIQLYSVRFGYRVERDAVRCVLVICSLRDLLALENLDEIMEYAQEFNHTTITAGSRRAIGYRQSNNHCIFNILEYYKLIFSSRTR